MRREGPDRAVVLAAGYGIRMRPLSSDLPKPLMPLWGRPMLEHALGRLRAWGVREVLINCHYAAHAVVEWIRARDPSGLRISLSFEPAILGTGGALARGAWFLDHRPFWVLNADVAADLDPAALVRRFRRGRLLAALWMNAQAGPRTVEVRRGMVQGFRSPQPGSAGTMTFCGLHLVSPRILDYLRAEATARQASTPGSEHPSAFAGIIETYERAMQRGERIAAVCVKDSFWADTGSPEQYLEAHRAVRDAYRRGAPGGVFFDPEMQERVQALAAHGVRVEGFVAVGDRVRVAAGCRVHDSVLWDGTRVARGARVERAVTGRGARAAGRVRGVVVAGSVLLTAPEQSALERLGWRTRELCALPLGPRGSDRALVRLRQAARTAMLIRYDAGREENLLYAGHARFLRSAGVRVPEVLHDDAVRRFTLYEDLGDRLLRDAVLGPVGKEGPSEEMEGGVLRRRAADATVLRLYQQVLDAAARLHGQGSRAARRRKLRLMPAFCAQQYAVEHKLFLEHFPGVDVTELRPPGGGGHDAPPQFAAIRGDLRTVARRLSGARHVLLHRDLQSSNILLTADGPAFVDFQGMRWGPAEYDLAALLCDPYVELPPDMQHDLLRYYAGRAGRDPAELTKYFWWAAIQRLVQALGAYGRLGALAGCGGFLTHVPAGLRMLRRAVGEVEGVKALKRMLNVEC